MPRSPNWDNEHESDDKRRGLARGLGYFSLGLGLAQVLAPRALARLIGAPRPRSYGRLMPALGVRELTAGVGLLTQPRHRPWAWGRVAGDVIDLALLGSLFSKRRANRQRVGWAVAAVAGVTALDLIAALDLGGRQLRSALSGSRRVAKSITIARPPEEVYAFWRDLRNLARFMAHIVSIEELDRDRSHWVVRGPAGRTVEWSAEIVADIPASRIAWRVLQSELPHDGVVRFERAPGNRGTEVHVELTYEAPLGAVGALAAKLFGEEPSQQIDGDLRRLKQVLETGEVMRSDASMGRGLFQPARPQAREPSLPGRSGLMTEQPNPEVH